MRSDPRRDFLTSELVSAKGQRAGLKARLAELEAAIGYLERQLQAPQPTREPHGQAAVGLATGIDLRPLRGIANEAERILTAEGGHLTARDLHVRLVTRGFSIKPASVARVLSRERGRFYHYPDGWGLAVAPQDLGSALVGKTTNEMWVGQLDVPVTISNAAADLLRSRWERG